MKTFHRVECQAICLQDMILTLKILDFERNWNSGGGNPYNSFVGGNGGLNQKNNSSPFERDFGGFNQNSNSGSNNFGNGPNNFGNGNNGSGGCQTYAVHLRGTATNSFKNLKNT